MMLRRLATLAAVLLCSTPSAQDLDAGTDLEGCKESTILKRYPKSIIAACEDKPFDEQVIRLGTTNEPEKAKTLEGRVERRTYWLPVGVTELEAARQFEAAFKKLGFTILAVLKSKDDDSRLVSAKLAKDGQETWAMAHSIYNQGGVQSELSIVFVKGMEQKIEVDAASLLEELNASGRVAVYGITFDTGKATLKPDSEKVLGEIQKLLAGNPGLKLKLEGHTDAVGQPKANLQLSKERAAAVKAWLVKRAVAAERLTTEGFGDIRPVGDNTTEEGKAKNRRVELVKA
jgi:OmpA-OmpF porin, OOP family